MAKPVAERRVVTPDPAPTRCAASPPEAKVVWRTDSFPLEIVGESHYQAAIYAVGGSGARQGVEVELEAVLMLEPDNPYDRNAVVLRIVGRTVGYLPREQAARVGGQMREDGIASVRCLARIVGGWREDVEGERGIGIRLAVPTFGWIDFGIGKERPKAPPKATKSLQQASGSGPLKGERIKVIGEGRDGPISRKIAKAGGSLTANLGATNTMLVFAGTDGLTPGVVQSAPYRKAIEMQSAGKPIRILSDKEVLDLIRDGKEKG